MKKMAVLVTALLLLLSLIGCGAPAGKAPEAEQPAKAGAEGAPAEAEAGAPEESPAPALSPEEQAEQDAGFAPDSEEYRRVDYNMDDIAEASRIYSFTPEGTLLSCKRKYVYKSAEDAAKAKEEWEKDRKYDYASLTLEGDTLYVVDSEFALDDYAGYNREQLDGEIDEVARYYAPAPEGVEIQNVTCSEEMAPFAVRQYNNFSVMATGIHYTPDYKLEVDVRVTNSNSWEASLYLSQLVVNGWYVYAEFADADEETGYLTVPGNQSVETKIVAMARDTLRFSDMEIQQIQAMDYKIYTFKNENYVCVMSGTLKNPDCPETYVQKTDLEGTVLFDDGRIRAVDLGKDELYGCTYLYVRNLRTIDDWGYFFEDVAGNMTEISAYTAGGYLAPYNFSTPTKSGVILRGDSTDAYCRKLGIQKPKTTLVGLSFDNTNPILLTAEVPGGKAEGRQPVKHDAVQLFSTPDVRISYIGIKENTDTPTLQLLFENLSTEKYICMQIRESAGRLDGEIVDLSCGYNVAAPQSQTVMEVYFNYDEEAGEKPVDLAAAKKLAAKFWVQERNKIYWGGLTYVTAEIDLHP